MRGKRRRSIMRARLANDRGRVRPASTPMLRDACGCHENLSEAERVPLSWNQSNPAYEGGAPIWPPSRCPASPKTSIPFPRRQRSLDLILPATTLREARPGGPHRPTPRAHRTIPAAYDRVVAVRSTIACSGAPPRSGTAPSCAGPSRLGAVRFSTRTLGPPSLPPGLTPTVR